MKWSEILNAKNFSLFSSAGDHEEQNGRNDGEALGGEFGGGTFASVDGKVEGCADDELDWKKCAHGRNPRDDDVQSNDYQVDVSRWTTQQMVALGGDNVVDDKMVMNERMNL